MGDGIRNVLRKRRLNIMESRAWLFSEYGADDEKLA
jgi:hypothetical protein